jgi:TRAP-type mannitol/chloroaromatic compound transport system permease small subunit
VFLANSRHFMQKLLLAVDRVSTTVGRICAWTIVALTALICWEVFSRYVLGRPHAWVFDAQIMLYGVLFMMAGAYTLAANGMCEVTCCTASSSRARRRSST